MAKKEFIYKEYSRRMFLLGTIGGVTVIITNFIQFMVQEAYHNIAYLVAYGVVLLVCVAIYCVRNQYNDKFCNTHKLYAVIAGLCAVIMLAVRIFRPELLTGQLKSLFGNAIDVNTLATFILIVLVGKPMLDVVDTMRYVQPAPTHIPPREED